MRKIAVTICDGASQDDEPIIREAMDRLPDAVAASIDVFVHGDVAMIHATGDRDDRELGTMRLTRLDGLLTVGDFKWNPSRFVEFKAEGLKSKGRTS